MMFDELYKQLLKENAIEEGLFKAIGGVADKAVSAVARDIAPKAKAAVDGTVAAVADGFSGSGKRGTEYSDDKEGQALLAKKITSLGMTSPIVVNIPDPAEEKLATLDKLEALGYGYPIKIGDIDYHYDTHNSRSLTTFDASGRRKLHPIEGLQFKVYPDYNKADKDQPPTTSAATPPVESEPAEPEAATTPVESEPAEPEAITFEPGATVTYTNKKGEVKNVTYLEDLGNGKSSVKFARGMVMGVSNDQLQEVAEDNESVFKSLSNELDAISEGLWANINAKKKRGGKSASKGSKAYKAAKKAGDNLESTKSEDAESSPGRVKRSGASCKSSVTELRKMAKKYGGEKGKMYHWCANMKGGKKKSEDAEGFNAFVKGTAKLAGKVAYDSADAITDFATDGQLRQAVSNIKDGIKYVKAAYEDTEDAEQRIDDKCWDGYKKIGTKKKGNKRVNDCVKEAKDTPKKK